MGLDKDDIKQLIAILQRGLVDTDDTDTNDIPKVTNGRTSKKKKLSKNKFESMKEKNMHKEDSLIDQKLCVNAPTERSRSYNPIKVQCRVCGKKEQVAPNLVESAERYKCNKCSISAG